MARSARDKRATHPRASSYTKPFSKDWERLSNSGRYDMRLAKSVMLELIANDAPLGPEWKDHPLKGGWAGYRECHIGGDFLLIYQIDEALGKGGTVFFARLGAHADLFNE